MNIINETIESLQRKIEAAKKLIKQRPDHEATFAEYTKEADYLEQAVVAGGVFGDFVRRIAANARRRNVVSTGSMILVESPERGGKPAMVRGQPEMLASLDRIETMIADKQADAVRHCDDAKAGLAAVTRAERSIPVLADYIAQRVSQIGRLKGGIVGIGGIFNQPFGTKIIVLDGEAVYIREAAQYANGLITSITKAESVSERINNRWSQAEADVARWVKENEVVTCGVRSVVYHSPDVGRYEAVALYRVINDVGGESRNHFPIDPYARTMFVPFDSSRVATLVRAAGAKVEGGALLSEWPVQLTSEGCAMALYMSDIGFE